MSGIGQDSVFNQLLLVLYIKDQLLYAIILLFADDTKIFRQVSTIENLDGLEKVKWCAYTYGRNMWLFRFTPIIFMCLSLEIQHYHAFASIKANTWWSWASLRGKGHEKDMELTQHWRLKNNEIMGLSRRTFPWYVQKAVHIVRPTIFREYLIGKKKIKIIG